MTAVLRSSGPPPEDDDPTIFAHVTEGLLALGASPVAQYLSDTSFSQAIQSSSTVTLQTLHSDVAPEQDHIVPKAVARLHQACQSTFGNTLALKYDFEGDEATHGKRCTLTITRSNGVTRTYASPITYGRKYDAKASASSIAIENGAIEFIMADDSNTINPRDATEHSDTPLEMDETVKTIEQCCLEWASGRIKPFWLIINEPKFGRTQGCALRIRLGSRNSRVYSVNTVYSSPAEAKKACAEVAFSEGVIDYIKSWSPSNTDSMAQETDLPSPIGLQQFLESLPQPFSEPVTGKSAIDINGPAWLNTTIQSARGGKMVPNFVWTVDPQHGFHGCLLRLERPGEVRSYLVDARFLKRMEAKAAVCLLAMSEGVGDYIRGVGRAVEDKLTPSMRKHASDVLLPTVLAEYRKVRGPGIHPTFEYDQELDACGATMLIELAPNPSAQQVQKYSVPAEYRSRNDAKLAVVLQAAEQGAIEFLRFEGKPPPAGYVPHYAQQDNQFVTVNKKRKWDHGSGGMNGGEWVDPSGYNGPTSNVGWQNKKPRSGGGFQGNISGPPPHAQGTGHDPSHRGHFVSSGGYRYQHDSKMGWNGQKKQASGSWQGNRISAPVGRGASQHKPGSRNSSAPQHFPYQHRPHIAPVLHPYTGIPMQPQPQPQQPGPSPSPAYAHVSVGAQPFQGGYYGAAPQAQQVPSHNTGPALMPQVPPYGVPNQLPMGGVAYPPYQQQASAVGTPNVVQHPAQYPYGPFPPVPAQSQVPVYQAYSAAQPLYYVAPFPPPAVPAPAPPAPPAPVHRPAPAVPPPPLHYTGGITTAAVPPPIPTTAPTVNPPYSYSGYWPFVGSQSQTQPRPPPPIPTPPAISSPPPPPPNNPPPLPSHSVSGKTPKSHTQAPGANKKGITIESTTHKTSATALYEYCQKNNKTAPQWSHEVMKGLPNEERRHKVSVVIERMKFELPVTFTSLSQGQEKIAKKVLEQLQHGKGAGGGV